MQVARGIQNKILEALAMARPIVASSCVEAIDVEPGVHLAVAVDVQDHRREIDALLATPARAKLMDDAARVTMQMRFPWPLQLVPLNRFLKSG